MNDIVDALYADLTAVAEEGDAALLDEGPEILQEYIADGLLDEVAPEPAEDGYTRRKIVGGDQDDLVVRYMEWPAEFSLMPHEHHGRPCFEVVTEGELAISDMVPRAVEDGYEMELQGTYVAGEGDVGLVDPADGEVHAVYSPVRARSIHVYPVDPDTAAGYELVDAEEDLYERRTFTLDD